MIGSTTPRGTRGPSKQDDLGDIRPHSKSFDEHTARPERQDVHESKSIVLRQPAVHQQRTLEAVGRGEFQLEAHELLPATATEPPFRIKAALP